MSTKKLNKKALLEFVENVTDFATDLNKMGLN